MKTYPIAILSLLIATFTCASAPRVSGGEIDFAFVNLDKCFNEYYKTKLADAQLKEQAKDFNEERKKLISDYEAKQEAFNSAREESQNTALSEDERNKRRNEAEEKLVELREYEAKIRNFDASRKKQLQDQSQRMRKRIVEEIKKSIQTYARNQGFTAVFDSSGESFNGVTLVVFNDEKVDITEDVLDLINKGKE